jgi:hypothetical protein
VRSVILLRRLFEAQKLANMCYNAMLRAAMFAARNHLIAHLHSKRLDAIGTTFLVCDET